MSRFIGNVSAYAYAVSKGYTGTEEEFAELMASYAEVGQMAVDAAESASASATASAQSASQASASEQGCERAVLDATSAAAIARARADEASGYAQTASTKASEAVGCVETATQKATEATQSASQALGYKNDAESAKTASQTAQGLAESARDSAVQAKTDAESARDEAQDIVDGINAKAEQIDNNTAEITELKNDGVAPSAEQLLSKNTTTDTVPYHFRQTGGNGADREYLDAVVGGTVGWNQLADVTDGKYVSTNAEPTLNTIKLYFKLQNQSTPYIYHETISSAKAVQTIVESTFTGLGEILHNGAQIQQKYAKNMNIVEGHKYLINLNFTSVDINTVGGVVVEDIMCIDLTAMFGSTIADYIYSLEQATAGAGVAWFRRYFPKDYYAYNAGELKSVEGVSAHKTVGFNKFDKSTVLNGYIINDATGDIMLVPAGKVTDYISVIPNQTYYIKSDQTSGGWGAWYDADKNYISSITGYLKDGDNVNKLHTAPSGARYMRLTCFYNNSGDLNTFCVNISDPARNGEYEPYEEHSYPLDSSLVLRGVFKLDANNNLYADGDVKTPDGKIVRNYGIVTINNANISVVSPVRNGNGLWCASFNHTGLTNKSDGQKISDKISVLNVTWSNANSDGIAKNSDTNSMVLCLTDATSGCNENTSKANVATEFTNYLNTLQPTIVFEQNTSTTEDGAPYQHLQQCDPNGTEEFVTTGIVPVGHNSFYPENLKAKIEGLPWNFANLIAPTESAFVATRNYTTGALLIVNNVLYKATSNIANGGTITPTTNCTATTLAEIISALS